MPTYSLGYGNRWTNKSRTCVLYTTTQKSLTLLVKSEEKFLILDSNPNQFSEDDL
jgi:hypothetical protein